MSAPETTPDLPPFLADPVRAALAPNPAQRLIAGAAAIAWTSGAALGILGLLAAVVVVEAAREAVHAFDPLAAALGDPMARRRHRRRYTAIGRGRR